MENSGLFGFLHFLKIRTAVGWGIEGRREVVSRINEISCIEKGAVKPILCRAKTRYASENEHAAVASTASKRPTSPGILWKEVSIVTNASLQGSS